MIEHTKEEVKQRGEIIKVAWGKMFDNKKGMFAPGVTEEDRDQIYYRAEELMDHYDDALMYFDRDIQQRTVANMSLSETWNDAIATLHSLVANGKEFYLNHRLCFHLDKFDNHNREDMHTYILYYIKNPDLLDKDLLDVYRDYSVERVQGVYCE